MEESERVMMESAALVQRAAEDYKRSLLGNQQFLTDQDKVEIEKVHQELIRLQLEMQSVAHERVVVDVLSRPVVQDIEHSRDARIQTKSRYNRDRNAEGANNSAANPPTTSVNEFIHIPQYVPGHLRGKNGATEGSGFVGAASSIATVRPVANTTLVPSMRVGHFPAELRNLKTTPVDYTGMPDQPTRRKRKNVSFEPLAKSLQSKFQATTLEMQRLKEQLAKADTRFNRERNKSMKKLKLIAQSLEDKQGYKDQALLSAVEQLVAEAMDSFRDVVDEVDLLQILEEIVEQIPSAADLFPPSAMAEEGHRDPHAPHQRHPHDDHQQQDYTVINVHHPKNHRPKPLTEIIRLPESPQQIPQSDYVVVEPSLPAAVTSQSQVSEAPAAAAAAPSLSTTLQERSKPSVVSMEKVTIETQTESFEPMPSSESTAAVTIVERPLESSRMETELVNLLHHVVDAQKTAMQGQQALLLTLVQERTLKQEQEEGEEDLPPPPPPPPLPIIEKEERGTDTSDLEVLTRPPVQAVEPVQQEVAEPVIPYRTAFGQAILGGQNLAPPYAVKAKLPLHHILAQAGLNEQGEVIDGPQQPLARRKAQPLTMQYINQPNYFEEERRNERERQIEEMEQKTEMERMMEFASKLAESMRPLAATQPQQLQPPPTMEREEIMRVVQEGVSTGVKQALEMINGPSSNTHQQRQPQARRRKTTIATAERKVLRKVGQDTNDEDSLDPQQLRQEVEQSRRHVENMKNDRDHQIHSKYHHVDEDNLSMDEEFHALYGDRHTNNYDSESERGSSIFSSDEEQYAVFDSTRRPGHSRKREAKNDDNEDDLSASNSITSTSSNFKEPDVFAGHGMLPPIYSNVLRHSATREAIDRGLLSKQREQGRNTVDRKEHSDDDDDDFFDYLPNNNNDDEDESNHSHPQVAESIDFDFGEENSSQANHSHSSSCNSGSSQRRSSQRPKRSNTSTARQAALRKVNSRLSNISMSIDSPRPFAIAGSTKQGYDDHDLSSVGELPQRDDDSDVVSLNSSVGSFNTSTSSADLANLARVSIPLLNIGRRYGMSRK